MLISLPLTIWCNKDSLNFKKQPQEASLFKGISWHAAHCCAGELSRPWAVPYLWSKMIDLFACQLYFVWRMLN